MLNIRRGFGRLLPLAALVVALPACDVTDPLEGVDLILETDDAPVSMNATVAVVPGEITSTTTTVSKPSEIKSVSDIASLTLKPSDFTFAATSGLRTASADASMGSGTIEVMITMNYANHSIRMGGTVTIVNNVVTDVTPAKYFDLRNFARYKESVIRTMYLFGVPQPEITAFETMTVEEVQAALEGAINQGAFSLTVNVTTSSPELTGSLRIGGFSLGGKFRL